ncbi:hypothetical protein BU23DRAFT_57057 [Bimuria novae-zelandiae CBS 107.79]|uniref:Cwf18 pre-mRNA splicing factor n=1 Tax=Bimuria novae-zelandiae CBS 107.79 TaxID=1447943 RepID=A0A6A5VGU3_9PLEO|nr:hypothetical protein BU23DRAFT_57057 [Bimuria novae-zelandiae CBS 107.79]
MSSHDHEKLSAAANDRKARLAQLKSLKRKQAPTEDDAAPSDPSTALTTTSTEATSTAPEEPSATATYLSGRNYDPSTRNVKLGFDQLPIADATATLEYKAQQLALDVKRAQEEEKAQDKGLDLFKLQPKKPNWDLKRDLQEKMRGLEVQTENAIARLVRERVEMQKKAQVAEKNGGNGDGEAEKVGMEGSELVEAMHLKEREEEEERRRDREDEDGS